MRQRHFRLYAVYSTAYLLVISVLVIILVGGKVTHPGFVLGLTAIVLGLLLLNRNRKFRTTMLVDALLFCVVELVACAVIYIGGDQRELWFASLYIIFSILIIIAGIMKRIVTKNSW